MIRAWILGAAVGLAGACFTAPSGPVLFSCELDDEGDGSACPPGYTCRDDDCCHANGSDVDAHRGECRLGGMGTAGPDTTGGASTDTGATNTTGDATTSSGTSTSDAASSSESGGTTGGASTGSSAGSDSSSSSSDDGASTSSGTG